MRVIPEGQVETIQQVMFELMPYALQSVNPDTRHSIDFRINVCAVSKYVGLGIEAWVTSHELSWDEDLDFNLVADEVCEAFNDEFCSGSYISRISIEDEHETIVSLPTQGHPFLGEGNWLAERSNRALIDALIAKTLTAHHEHHLNPKGAPQ
tara:strand:+ start:5069 stop:5524 length:456 start_codon:yes stop_codon:yes gene_type:complete